MSYLISYSVKNGSVMKNDYVIESKGFLNGVGSSNYSDKRSALKKSIQMELDIIEIEEKTDYDVINNDDFSISIINRFSSDDNVTDINIYNKSLKDIIVEINNL